MHYKILEQSLKKAEAEIDERQKRYLALLKQHKEALAVIHDLKQNKIRLKNELSEARQRLGIAERKIKDMENENGYSILYTYEHRGFVLQQTSYNWHYMIINSDGRPVMHCQYSEKLSEDEAKRMIDDYLELREEVTVGEEEKL
jgi:septal ring factor EnvC (AmiA/AmiB activator)